jgi:hypothetical protein
MIIRDKEKTFGPFPVTALSRRFKRRLYRTKVIRDVRCA